MKYMGSKRAMLQNGLGEELARRVPEAVRFVDLFTGSGAVAWHVATHWGIPVLAVDLQAYATALAGAVVCRDTVVDGAQLKNDWFDRAEELLSEASCWNDLTEFQDDLGERISRRLADEARQLCELLGPIGQAYGGYYYSPMQAAVIEGLRATLPETPNERRVAIAALIQAGSRCAASPGHTAQPFKPNSTAGKFLLEAWRRDVWDETEKALKAISSLAAKVSGDTHQGDAVALVPDLIREGDLVFLDPPYSGVHYSRFYHVLETIARGEIGEVSGTGRYPAPEERPRSAFSVMTESRDALDTLLQSISAAGGRVIMTFPAGKASNGLSGVKVKNTAEKYFKILSQKISSRFSTLGGNRENRDARIDRGELILTLLPK